MLQTMDPSQLPIPENIILGEHRVCYEYEHAATSTVYQLRFNNNQVTALSESAITTVKTENIPVCNSNQTVTKSITAVTNSRNNVEVEVDINTIFADKKDEPSAHSKRINDRLKNFVSIHDRIVPPKARAVLPTALQCRRDVITPYHRALPPKVRFGPVVGICKKISRDEALISAKKSEEKKKPIFLLTNEDDTVTYIDMTDLDKSNWLALLPLGQDNTANVWLQQIESQLYAVTTASIQVTTALTLGYGKEYADLYGLVNPVLDINDELSRWPSEWWCSECSRAMPSLLQLEIHVNKCHQDNDKSICPQRYRCRFCTKSFSRLFCLKQHVRRCPMRNIKSKSTPEQNKREPLNISELKEISDALELQNTEITTRKTYGAKSKNSLIELNVIDIPQTNTMLLQNDITQSNVTTDDSNRLHSDESLQNILDMSTSLFDTDRISNLDISGSKSDDFNGYSFKDDVRLTNDFDFTNGLLDGFMESHKTVREVKKPASQPRASSPFTCPYCKQSMSRRKLRIHSRNCTARRFDCVCGKVFRNKDKLAQHIKCSHPQSTEDAENTDAKVAIKYKCEYCDNLEFKRRGMYVNHLLKVHEQIARAPLMVRDRIFPCPTCQKIYMTASKRDHHVRANHPGTEYDRKYCLEGSKVHYKSAFPCQICSRQYATKAKLSQHHRQTHEGQMPKSVKTSIKRVKKSIVNQMPHGDQ